MTAALFATLQTLARGGTLSPDLVLTDKLSGFARKVRPFTIAKLLAAGYIDFKMQITPAGRAFVARITADLKGTP